ncbi:DinB family protein [Reinekea blandensis]|uniref:DinB family protein n=1 Tax=Reinekea blandensis MED297 TaxID=314283 RepID=A4BI64_9GAMM|nr:DinB family protein [Reinekea blandensis]EAR08207.1 hypothetical protein MED297_14750 [Reinekea sp. MED297] [Reinekea blandensis MED297]
MKTLCYANNDVLDQLALLIELTRPVYRETAEGAQASIGQHVRHILDHYRAVKTGIEENCIDYNRRHRNSPVEHCPESALETINELKHWLSTGAFTNNDIAVISEICLNTTQSERLHSNLSRELLYLINHSIHHMAYSSVLAKQLNINLPAHIGLAPGTRTHLRHQSEELTHA